jgi:hypothetical protein
MLFDILLGLAIGYMVHRFFESAKEFKEEQQAREMIQHMKNEFEDTILMYIEEVGEITLAYDGRTHEFLCQGNSPEELVDNFKDRYKGKKAKFIKFVDEKKTHFVVLAQIQ